MITRCAAAGEGSRWSIEREMPTPSRGRKAISHDHFAIPLAVMTNVSLQGLTGIA